MSRCRIVAFSGNLQRPSRTRSLVEAIGSEAARRVNAELRVFDLLDAGPALAGSLTRTSLPLAAARLIDAIESADALVAGSPVYKGAIRDSSSTCSTSSSPTGSPVSRWPSRRPAAVPVMRSWSSMRCGPCSASSPR